MKFGKTWFLVNSNVLFDEIKLFWFKLFLVFVISREKANLKTKMCSVPPWFPDLGQTALLKFCPVNKSLFSPPSLGSFFSPKLVTMLSVASHSSSRYFPKACPHCRNLWYNELCRPSKDACKTLHIHTAKCSKWFVFLPKNTWIFLVFSKGYTWL